jgi:hypothetical protein
LHFPINQYSTDSRTGSLSINPSSYLDTKSLLTTVENHFEQSDGTYFESGTIISSNEPEFQNFNYDTVEEGAKCIDFQMELVGELNEEKFKFFLGEIFNHVSFLRFSNLFRQLMITCLSLYFRVFKILKCCPTKELKCLVKCANR